MKNLILAGAVFLSAYSQNPIPPDVTKKPARKKMSYKLKLELERLPAKIEGLEEEIVALQARMASSDFYTQSHEVVEEVIASLTAAERTLEEAEERWLELEEEAE